jgi:RNA polymerase sigma-70 factor (ECF subfamily)
MASPATWPAGDSSANAGSSRWRTKPAATIPWPTWRARERADLVWNGILALPLHYREAVVLCDLQGLSYEETAMALGCAVGTVRSRLHRGREQLAQRLRSAQPLAAAAMPVPRMTR